MSLKEFSEIMLPAIETELQKQVDRLNEPLTEPLQSMLTYHLGWSGEGSGSEARGKRIRPLIVLLTCAACNGDWKPALPAAAAVELVHNFSLVHDDIQDNSSKRRGRDTVWVKWGVPQGINAGDALFVLSNLAIMDLAPDLLPQTVKEAAKILHNACLDLTRGQFLDISFEQRSDLTVEDYWPMVGFKTASLLASCCALGALIGGADQASREAYQNFGHSLGLAFQVQDDYLGIWGDWQQTGKSAESDLITKKKSLPVLFGLGKRGKFSHRWEQGPINQEDVGELANQLSAEGAQLFTRETADQMTDMAITALRTAEPKGKAGDALFELANKLLIREA
jgi:geranylgeranyl diphosphate synthase type I